MHVNEITIIGNTTGDYGVEYDKYGKKYFKFIVATNIDDKNVEYHSCKAYGKLCENLEKNMNKGKYVYLKGFIRTHDNIKYIIVTDFIFLGKK